MIKVENLIKTFGPNRAVDGVSFSVERGEVLGFLGPNGAGKSTSMRMITGFIPPTSGTVRVGGFDMLDHFPDVGVQDREQDRFLGVEIMIERAARQLAGVRKVGDGGAHIALRRKQPRGIGQYAEMDAVVIFRACSRHQMLPASIQL